MCVVVKEEVERKQRDKEPLKSATPEVEADVLDAVRQAGFTTSEVEAIVDMLHNMPKATTDAEKRQLLVRTTMQFTLTKTH